MTWLDTCFGRFGFYRKLSGGIWYQHTFTNDAIQISYNFIGNFWARYPKINRYSDVVTQENYFDK